LTTPAPPPTLRRMARPAADKTDAEAALRAGTPLPQIARETGLSVRTLQRLARGLGLGKTVADGQRGPAAGPRGNVGIALQVLLLHEGRTSPAQADLAAAGYYYSAQRLRAIRARWISDGD